MWLTYLLPIWSSRNFPGFDIAFYDLEFVSIRLAPCWYFNSLFHWTTSKVHTRFVIQASAHISVESLYWTMSKKPISRVSFDTATFVFVLLLNVCKSVQIRLQCTFLKKLCLLSQISKSCYIKSFHQHLQREQNSLKQVYWLAFNHHRVIKWTCHGLVYIIDDLFTIFDVNNDIIFVHLHYIP